MCGSALGLSIVWLHCDLDRGSVQKGKQDPLVSSHSCSNLRKMNWVQLVLPSLEAETDFSEMLSILMEENPTSKDSGETQ